MASKKKAKAGAHKAKAGARKTKAGARKTKASARKAGARKMKAATPKKKAGATKAKASASKAKASASKAKASASKAKAGASKAKAKRAPTRKHAPVTVAKEKPLAAVPSGPVIVEVIEESLVDVSTVLRIKDGVARSQRDIDEDELKQFPDPSLVIEAQTSPPREDETDPSISQLPDLFAAEARRQKERLDDRPADVVRKPQDSSLFGSLDALDDEPEPEPDED